MQPGLANFDPQSPPRFKITRKLPIATAGSCFAQHMHRVLTARGYGVLDYEAAPPWLDAQKSKAHQYGIFSARYGNIYTPTQLRQLFDRAFGKFSPSEDYWEDSGTFYDPYRPSVQPGGFESIAALKEDRENHFEAVRRVFQDAKIFIFTLGLTEGWRSKKDGALFPVCPGCGVGTFDAARHEFVNLGVAEIVREMSAFCTSLKALNPECKILLTVSPVPLVATFENRNVVESTVYSKSVLRVAAEEMRRAYDHIDYFSSYEIISVGSRRGSYFEDDQRNVSAAGVSHVTRIFLQKFGDGQQEMKSVSASDKTLWQRLLSRLQVRKTVICDEEVLEQALAQKRAGELEKVE